MYGVPIKVQVVVSPASTLLLIPLSGLRLLFNGGETKVCPVRIGILMQDGVVEVKDRELAEIYRRRQISRSHQPATRSLRLLSWSYA